MNMEIGYTVYLTLILTLESQWILLACNETAAGGFFLKQYEDPIQHQLHLLKVNIAQKKTEHTSVSAAKCQSNYCQVAER